MKILLKDRMTEEELEDRIWNVCEVEIPSLSKIWAKVGGNRNLCFAKVKEMIQRYDLKKTDEGNYVRVDSTQRFEFEFGLSFQISMLEQCRDYISGLKKPLFELRYTVLHTIPPLVTANMTKAEKRKRTADYNKNPKKYKIDEEIPIYKPRNRNITKAMKTMSFYHNTFLLYISRSYLQGSLNLVKKREVKRRIEKCENALGLNFKKLLADNPKDSNALRQYLEFDIYKIENFRIA